MRQLDQILLLLTGLILFFTLMLMIVSFKLSSDGQTFQIMGNVLSGLVGALLMRVKTDNSSPDPPAGMLVKSTTTAETIPAPGDTK